LADCDENEVERAGFDCVAVAEIGEEENLRLLTELGDSTEEASQFAEVEEEEEEEELE